MARRRSCSAFSSRRIRSVRPLALTFSVITVAGSVIASRAIPSAIVIPEALSAMPGHFLVRASVLAGGLGFLIALVMGSFAVRALSSAHRRQWFSDQSLLVTVTWLTYTALNATVASVQTSNPAESSLIGVFGSASAILVYLAALYLDSGIFWKSHTEVSAAGY